MNTVTELINEPKSRSRATLKWYITCRDSVIAAVIHRKLINMARQEHVLTVFAASPGDVEAERGKLEDVIRELNVTWSRELGIRLDLVRWETHAYLGFGADGQDVINQEIPDDCDIFVGIMWCRYGTPTGRAGSW